MKPPHHFYFRVWEKWHIKEYVNSIVTIITNVLVTDRVISGFTLSKTNVTKVVAKDTAVVLAV